MSILLFLSLFFSASEWQPIWSEGTLTAYAQEVPGNDLPTYKIQGILDENMYEVLAVLNDFSRHQEWLFSMSSETKIIWRPDDFHIFMYSRFDSPWPVWDRDVIMKVEINLNQETQEINATLEDIMLSQRPTLPDVVRSPHVMVLIYMKYIDETHTEIEGIMEVDPGGDIPNWMVKIFSKQVPHDSLVRLKGQIRKTKGQYEGFINKYGGH